MTPQRSISNCPIRTFNTEVQKTSEGNLLTEAAGDSTITEAITGETREATGEPTEADTSPNDERKFYI